MKPNFKKERELWGLGYENVCGIDEAGRGALAGPLVSGAVILRPETRAIFNDSKVLSSCKREYLFEKIKSEAIDWAIGLASVEEINLHGIQASTYMSYIRAIGALGLKPSFLLIDHYRLPSIDIPQFPITRGDRISQSIAAASIVAKVTRDHLMQELDKDFPAYYFSKNFGYGTRLHQEKIRCLGSTDVHRTKFVDKPWANQLNFI